MVVIRNRTCRRGSSISKLHTICCGQLFFLQN